MDWEEFHVPDEEEGDDVQPLDYEKPRVVLCHDTEVRVGGQRRAATSRLSGLRSSPQNISLHCK